MKHSRHDENLAHNNDSIHFESSRNYNANEESECKDNMSDESYKDIMKNEIIEDEINDDEIIDDEIIED